MEKTENQKIAFFRKHLSAQVNKILLFFLNFLFFSYVTLSAQSQQLQELRFRHISSQHGLSNNIVNCIAQDHKGFIWIGTMEGLNRYDGNNITVFKRILNDSASLADNMIFDIYIDHFDDVWIGTQYGICLYNSDLENFKTFIPDPSRISVNAANRVTGMQETSSNELIVAVEQGTLFKYDREAGEFKPYTENFQSIKDFIIDKDGYCWMGGAQGLFKYDLNSHETIHYNKFIDKSDEYSFGEINALFEEGDTIWIGTIKGRIFFLSKSTNEIKALKHNFDFTYYIYDIFKDSRGLFYILSTDGLYVYNKESDNYISYKYEQNNPSGLSRVGTTTIFEDFQSNLWIGSYQGGVNLVVRGKEFYNYNEFSKTITLDIVNVNSIMEDSQGKIWIGSFDNGINVVDLKTNKRMVYRNNENDPNSLGYGSVFSIFEDSRQNVWVGTYLGYLQKFNPVTNNFQSYPFENGKGLDVRSIHEDGDGMLWIISHGNGMSRFDPATGHYKHFRRDETNLNGSIPDDWAFQLIQDHTGYFWIATPSGLSRFERKTETFTNFYHLEKDTNSLCNNFINVLFEDSNNNLWVGTKFGLSQFDRRHNRFINFYEEDGLPSNQIKAILENRPGELWISTGNGLSRMRYSVSEADGNIGVKFRNYNESDNLQDIFFWDRSACRTSDGRLIFGCERGIVVFAPDNITENQRIPDVFITSFELYNKRVIPGEPGSVLKVQIDQTKEIKLRHNQNFFSFSFLAINYISNENNQYRYMLEGFDADWVEAGNEHKAAYTNVGPGKYEFRVIASNNDGYWNNEGASVKITITPPITATWWFRILMGILIVTCIIYISRRRVTILRRQNVLLESKVEERVTELSDLNLKIKQQNELLEKQKSDVEKAYEELTRYRNKLEDLVEERTKELIIAKDKAEESDKLKSSFLANLSHEIRTPLNSIIGFSGLIADSKTSAKERLSFKSIIEGSNNMLLSLINDIIDFSKMESGHLDIILKEVILDSIFEDIQKIFNLEINKLTHLIEKDLEFRINISENSKGLILVTDEVRLKQLLSILINNAIKFTQKGFVEVGCSLLANSLLRFYVKDTGIGIEKQFHSVIFERFRKIEEDNHLYRGAGIGLSIAKELVKLLGGTIEVDSSPGVGTTFSFNIPVKSKEVKKLKSTAARPANEIPDFSGRKILIAEDDFSSYIYLEKLLCKTNATIIHAVNGKEAISLYEQNPDLSMIFLDIKMPEVNGFEALEALKQRQINIPVFAQTAYAFSDEVKKIKESGFSEYISKPIHPDELFRIISAYL
jgi:signal transduction histidine kinase/ligand-binding sensor domain-containing protein/CheY-like chemotaxis protein